MKRAAFVGLAVVASSFAFASAAQAKSCADFDSQAEAQRYLRAHPQDPDKLDPDNNGVACENAPSPEDFTPVRHVVSSGSTIPLEQDSPTTRPPGGTTSTSPSGGATTTAIGEDTETTTTQQDTTNQTVSVNQQSDDAGISTTGIVATLLGVVLFGAVYIWMRRR
jgi:cobalamin biosynthesis Mg chelatase CobN